MTDTGFNLLLIEPRDTDAQAVTDAVESIRFPGLAYESYATLAAAVAAMKSRPWDVIMSAGSLPDGPTPQELLHVFQEVAPIVPVILTSHTFDESFAARLISEGAHAYLPKDQLNSHTLHVAIHSALQVKRLREQLTQRRLEMHQLVDGLADGIVVIDSKHKIRFANPAAKQLLGSEQDPIGATKTGIPLTPGLHTELEFDQPNGTKITVDVNVSFVVWDNQECFLACLRSVSERKRLEAQRIDMERKLLAHQKLESLGMFAGGIAHDFNNLLAGIMGHAEVLNLEIDRDSAGARSVELIKNASKRAATLCEQLLAYAGKGAVYPTANDFNQLIRSNDELLRTSLGSQVGLTLDLEDDIPSVLADASQFTQVLLNLVINAREAIPKPPGTTTIRTHCLGIDDIDLEHAAVAPEQPEAQYVGLEVSDDGVGMAEETISRMFEPFYSTKDDSRGLGLSTVLGIVQGHGGILTVDSTLGSGTTFGIYLPASNHPTPPPEVQQESLSSTWNFDATVLVVDDELQVREVACRILKRFGCQVVNATSGEDALTLVALQPNDIDIVLLDLSMPGLSGGETLRAIRDRFPSLKVVLMSGFEETHATAQIGDNNVEGFLKKPFSIKELGTAISRIVGSQNQA